MKIQKIFKLILVVALISPAFAFAKKLEVDPNHSAIAFEATHLKISKIPGRFTEFSGTVDLDEKDITRSKVDFTVNISSITTAVVKRDDHLRTPDFFDAQKFPKATFQSSEIKKSGKGYVLKGDLTIRDVTKKVSFQMKNLGKVEDPMMKTEKYVFSATGKINRKDFGVNFGPDAIVGDIVDLWINLETMQAAVDTK
ncbi:MAG: hypothetical protein B7Y39_10025 [Bdellovibrio sp. 28-41-41]|nr:MAG: hypothetical protein B7Y39_10025 [Bdellovibrio sp. 28-41-41]